MSEKENKSFRERLLKVKREMRIRDILYCLVCVILIAIFIAYTQFPTLFLLPTAKPLKVETLGIPDYDVVVRVPRGFSSHEEMVNYAIQHKIVNDVDRLLEPITIGELCSYMQNLYKFRKMPDGFSDTVCEDEVDISKVPDTSKYKGAIKFCLEHGYITTEQASRSNETISMNHFTRIMYRIGYNGLKVQELSEQRKKDILEMYDIPEDAPTCRKQKIIFLEQQDIMPVTNQGKFLMEKKLTKIDAISSLLLLSDQIYLYWEGSEGINSGCQPCALEEMKKDRK